MDEKYISVEALFEKTTRRNHIWDAVTNAEGKGLTEIVNDIPAADVRPVVRGEWQEGEFGYLTCSICGCDTNLFDAHGSPIGSTPEYHNPCYCPHCGADMRPEPPEREVLTDEDTTNRVFGEHTATH